MDKKYYNIGPRVLIYKTFLNMFLQKFSNGKIEILQEFFIAFT